MACTHPSLERIRKPDGTIGVRCPFCGSVAYSGDSFWALLKRNLFQKGRRSLSDTEGGA